MIRRQARPRRWPFGLLLALAVLVGPPLPPAAARPGVAHGVAPAAVAGDPPAPDGQAYPSTGEIDRAESETDRRAAAAAAIEAQLAGARTELDQAGQRAEEAVEAYDGAQARLARARANADTAATGAARAAAARADAAEQAAALAAATYRSGTSPELSAFNDLLGARGPRAAGEQAEAVGAAGRSTRQILDAATATAKAADDAQLAARTSADDAERAAGAVARARSQAQSLLTARTVLVADLSARRERLLGELAAARDTTVELERRRQQALEQIAAQQAEAAAKAAAEAAAAKAAAAAAAAADPPAAPPQEDGARAAIDFARAHLGLPYVWGGEGPDGYDCSGLTMQAWRQGGKTLTHFAADQYAESTPVDYQQLRPGDLVFWSHTGKAADIHHVAIYLGDDQIIEAPRTGDVIKQASLWVLGTPDFYARP
ncbi:C40 family peptidase [Kitasatospora viridis]|uniref:Cell wall-associated NlpC family hydrolase n=1 Tax=Kitasatospora viridis TaxID=281105 RepID=A0A561UIJ5_9ACTN|nr:C40 family peptidase [Kitasatospora viridis]TWF99198.1 cell wall-associated NlpC family hydrolase [Kitasatospora viridis]